MNNIITLPLLAQLFSEAAGCDRDEAQQFLLSFTDLIADGLASDGHVRIKGLGVFKRVLVKDKVRVEFVPDRDFADFVNAPFAFFEPVDLDDSVSADMLDGVGEPHPVEEPDPITEEIILPPVVEEVVEEPQSVEDEVIESVDIPIKDETQETQPVDDPVEDEVGETQPADEPVEDEVEETQPADDPVEDEVVEIQPVDEPVEDEVEKTQPVDQPIEEEVEETQPADEPVEDEVEETQPVDDPIEEEVEVTQPVDDVVEETIEVSVDDVDPVEDKYDAEATENQSSQEYVMDEDEDTRSSVPWFWIALMFVFGVLAGFGVGYFCHDTIMPIHTQSTEQAESEDQLVDEQTPLLQPQTGLAESGETDEKPEIDQESVGDDNNPNADTQTVTDEQQQAADNSQSQTSPNETPSQNVVYDKVTQNRTLTKMAKEHYGNKDYWVYIYMENSNVLRNPNNIKIGTQLRIPPKEKYDVSTDEAENIAAAKEKARELFNKYGN